MVAGDRVFVYFWSVELLRHTFARLASCRTRPRWSLRQMTVYPCRKAWVVNAGTTCPFFPLTTFRPRGVDRPPCNFLHGVLADLNCQFFTLYHMYAAVCCYICGASMLPCCGQRPCCRCCLLPQVVAESLVVAVITYDKV